MVRSAEFPLGLPDPNIQSRADVRVGNALVLFCGKFLASALRLRIPSTLENPRFSLMWRVPGIERLIKSKNVDFCHTDFCQFGTTWRKSTGILGIVVVVVVVVVVVGVDPRDAPTAWQLVAWSLTLASRAPAASGSILKSQTIDAHGEGPALLPVWHWSVVSVCSVRN